jgi:membrane protein
VLAVVVWIVASLAFGYYVKTFADYNAMYGSIGAIIVLLLYFYISAAVLLLGAEMNAVIDYMSAEGKRPDDTGAGGEPQEHEKKHVSGLGRDHSHDHSDASEGEPLSRTSHDS